MKGKRRGLKMGVILVSFTGPFMSRPIKSFSALHGGHAQAIAETIEWLSGHMLPKAIQQDHLLQSQGEKPEKGFGSSEME